MNGKNQNFDMLKLKFLGAKVSFYAKVSTLLVKVHTKIMDASIATVKKEMSIIEMMELSVPDELRQTIDSFTK
jgi:hypothetical protein